MNKKNLIPNLPVLLILIAGIIFMFTGWKKGNAASSKSKPIVWGKTIGGKHIDIAYCVQQTSDGGYIIAGETFSLGSGKGDAYVIRLDNMGNKVWEKQFGGKEWDNAQAVQQTADGGYIVAGGTRSFGSGKGDAYIIKLDSKGNKVWEKQFGGKEWDNAQAVRQTADGGYIVAGGTRSFGSDKGEAYIIRLDKKGNKIWERMFKGKGLAKAHSIQQTTDGGYIVAGGSYSSSTGKGEVYIIKLDSKGKKVWEKMIGGEGSSRASSVQQTTDGGYIIAGQISFFESKKKEAYIIKLDSKGEKLWDKTLGIKDLDPASFVMAKESKGTNAQAVQQTADGGYIVAIVTYSKARIGDAYIVRLDSKGDEIWKKTVGVKDLNEKFTVLFRKSARVYPHSIRQTSDGGYIVAGGISDEKEGISDIYIVKTDPNGNIR